MAGKFTTDSIPLKVRVGLQSILGSALATLLMMDILFDWVDWLAN